MVEKKEKRRSSLMQEAGDAGQDEEICEHGYEDSVDELSATLAGTHCADDDWSDKFNERVDAVHALLSFEDKPMELVCEAVKQGCSDGEIANMMLNVRISTMLREVRTKCLKLDMLSDEITALRAHVEELRSVSVDVLTRLKSNEMRLEDVMRTSRTSAGVPQMTLAGAGRGPPPKGSPSRGKAKTTDFSSFLSRK